jgi:hypothetical protein
MRDEDGVRRTEDGRVKSEMKADYPKGWQLATGSYSPLLPFI